MRSKLLAAFGLLLCLGMQASYTPLAYAEPVVLLGDHSQPIELGPHYQLFVDSHDSATIEQILLPQNKAIFSDIKEDGYNLGYRKETHWFKVDVSNKNNYELKQLLEFNFPLLDDIGIYIVNKASKRILSRYDAGDTQPFDSRMYLHANFVFPLTLPAQTDLTFYFRIKSKGRMSAGATLWQPNVFAKINQPKYFLFALYTGLLLGLISYNLLLFSSFRDRTYLYYVFLTSSFLLAVGSFNGIWFEFLWPKQPEWHNLSTPVGIALSGLFASLLSKSFLRTKINSPYLDKLINGLSVSFILLLIATPYISSLYVLPILYICLTLLAASIIISSLRLSFEGERPALIYLIAWLPIIIGIGSFYGRNIVWVSAVFTPSYTILITSMFTVVLLAYALARRLNVVSKEFEQFQHQKSLSNNQLFYALQNSERELLNRLKSQSEALEEANQKLIAQQTALQKHVHKDPLTGLASETLIKEQVAILLTRCKREKSQLACLIIQIDNFNNIVDKYSAEIAEKLLVTISTKLHETLRYGDIFGRLNDNEFILIVESENGKLEHESVAKRIKKALTHRILIDGYSTQVDLVIGAAIYPSEGETLDTLIKVSHKRIQRSKDNPTAQ